VSRAPLAWRAAAAAVIGVPALCLVVGTVTLFTRGIGPIELTLAVSLYVFTGLGITVGFHRGFTHRAYQANRALKIALGVAGTMAAQGALDEWVAAHRLHHAKSDQPGDPHSPWERRDGGVGGWRGLWWSHAGWLAHGSSVTDTDELAGDITEDRDLAFICRHTLAITLAGVFVPFVIGVALTGALSTGLWCALWAGGVRICVLHHVTWAINSVCHLTGARPFRSRDRSGNVAWLSMASFGESWHNAHHTWPNLARHGVARGQFDLSAEVIRGFERVGWVTKVRWPKERVHATVVESGLVSRERPVTPVLHVVSQRDGLDDRVIRDERDERDEAMTVSSAPTPGARRIA
jgi:stearoyl-CoA desaturase (delta-9 desaturase)